MHLGLSKGKDGIKPGFILWWDLSCCHSPPAWPQGATAVWRRALARSITGVSQEPLLHSCPKKRKKLHPWISRTAALVAASCLCFSFTLEKSAASYHELRFGFLRFSWKLSSSKAARCGLSLRLQFGPEYASVSHWTFPQNGIKVYNVVGLRPYLNLVAFLALVELWLDRKPDLCSKYYFFLPFP